MVLPGRRLYGKRKEDRVDCNFQRRIVRIEILKGKQILDSGLAERIIEFDKLNMQPVFEKAGIAFPVEKRRKGFERNPTFIIAFDGSPIAGYIEYLRSWNDSRFIYIGSIQIAEKYRNTRLILKLLSEFKAAAANEDFAGFETNVQKANSLAVKMYQKIGFKLEENPHNPASWRAVAGKDLLETSPVVALIEKWLKKARTA